MPWLIIRYQYLYRPSAPPLGKLIDLEIVYLQNDKSLLVDICYFFKILYLVELEIIGGL